MDAVSTRESAVELNACLSNAIEFFLKISWESHDARNGFTSTFFCRFWVMSLQSFFSEPNDRLLHFAIL